ncbi:tail fiber assembly protein [Xenorhabdus thuongxuanensis]|nr:tail fiber assembly protein [Xenorhabdus thuongxuanensis]
MKYKYSDNKFYPYELKNNYIKSGAWPEVGIDVDESVFAKYTATPPMGKERVVGSDGLPAWGDIPPPHPPSPEELQQRAESQKKHLLNTATEKIAIFQDAVDLDMATDAEKSALTDWRKYRVLLNRVDCATVPDIQWPEPPK